MYFKQVKVFNPTTTEPNIEYLGHVIFTDIKPMLNCFLIFSFIVIITLYINNTSWLDINLVPAFPYSLSGELM